MQNCDTVHPLDSPVHISISPNCVICVPCILHTVSRHELIPSVRQAALAELFPLISNSSNLESIGISVLSTLQARLLQILLSEKSKTPLTNQLIQFITHICQKYNATSTSPVEHLQQLFESLIDAVFSNHQQHVIPLIASLLSLPKKPAFIDQFRIALSTRAFQFVSKLLSQPMSEQDWPAVSKVISQAVASYPSEFASNKIFPLIDAQVSPRRNVEPDLAYLSIVQTILKSMPTNRAASYLTLPNRPCFIILKKSIISSDNSASSMALSIVAKLALVSSAASALCENGIIDYMFETLRRKPPNLLTLNALASIAKSNPQLLVTKWTFALDAFMSVSECVTSDYIPEFLAVMRCSFETAPLPVFSVQVVQQTVGFIMRLFLQLSRVDGVNAQHQIAPLLDEGVHCLVTLLARYDLSIDGIYNVLLVCNAGSDLTCMFFSSIHLFIACIKHFQRLVSLQNADGNQEGHSDMLRQLGKHMVNTVLYSWARLFTGELESNTAALNLLGSTKNIVLVMQMFVAALDAVFVLENCISWDEHLEIRKWCWCNLPIRTVFSFPQKDPIREDFEISLRNYIASLIVTERGTCKVDKNDIPTNERAFLRELANDRRLSQSLSFQIFQSGLKFGNLGVVCRPDLILYSLTSRLINLSSCINESDSRSIHGIEILRGISVVCSIHRMVFPSQCLHGDVVAMVVEGIAKIRDDTDFDLFCKLICADIPKAQFRFLWETLVKTSETTTLTAFVEGWNAKLCDLLISNPKASSGLIQALLHSSIPHRISDYIGQASTTYQGKQNLVMALYKQGASHHAVKTLTQVQGCWKDKNLSSNIRSEAWKVHTEKYSTDCLRVCSLLDLLTLCDTVQGSIFSWELLHAFRDSLPDNNEFEQEAHIAALHTSILRYLIFIAQSTEDQKVLSYISQRKIISHCTSVLKRALHLVCPLSQQTEEILSFISCFLVSFLKNESSQKNVYSAMRRQLPDVQIWDNLLVAHEPEGQLDISVTTRIANACILLETYIICAKQFDSSFTTIKLFSSYRALTFAGVATASPNIFLSRAAYSLLCTLMKIDGQGFQQTIMLSQFRVICHLTQVHLCVFQKASKTELDFLEQVIIQNKIDENLVEIHNSLLQMWKNCDDENSYDELPTKEKSDGRCLMSTVSRVYLVVRAKIHISPGLQTDQLEIVPEKTLNLIKQSMQNKDLDFGPDLRFVHRGRILVWQH